MATFHIEGLEGGTEAILFPEAFEKYGHFLTDNALLMFAGLLKEDSGREDAPATFQVLEIHPLNKVHELFCDRASIHLNENTTSPEILQSLKEIIGEFQGNTALTICVEFIEGAKIFIRSDNLYRVRPCQKLAHRIEQILGEGMFYVSSRPDALLYPPQKRKWEKR
jgi:DNA polymerase III alpha subunit